MSTTTTVVSILLIASYSISMVYSLPSNTTVYITSSPKQLPAENEIIPTVVAIAPATIANQPVIPAAVIGQETAAVVTAAVATTTTRRPLLQGVRSPCTCIAGHCGCCTGLILERFQQKACVNMTYDPDDFAVTASMSLNERTLYKNTFSGKNPPPMCIRVPRFRFIELCVEFSNIYIASRNIHLCIDAEASWQDFTLLEWSFDCVRLGASGVAVVGPEDGGGLPGSPLDEEDQTDEDYDDSARNVPLPLSDTDLSTPNPYAGFTKKDQWKNIPLAADEDGRIPISVERHSNGDIQISFGNELDINRTGRLD